MTEITKKGSRIIQHMMPDEPNDHREFFVGIDPAGGFDSFVLAEYDFSNGTWVRV